MDGDALLSPVDEVRHPPSFGFCERPIRRRGNPTPRAVRPRSARPPASARILIAIGHLETAVMKVAGDRGDADPAPARQ
jgi:hypothetical protein